MKKIVYVLAGRGTNKGLSILEKINELSFYGYDVIIVNDLKDIKNKMANFIWIDNLLDLDYKMLMKKGE